MTVGIIGRPDDEQVLAVRAALGRSAAEPVVLSLDRTEIASWEWTTDSITRPDGTDLAQFDAIYVRSVTVDVPRHTASVVAPVDEEGWLDRAGRSLRWLETARSAQQALEDHGVRMVNPVESFWFHRSKPGADQRLAEAGIPVPRGLVTSDPSEVRTFAREVGEVVYKPVAGGGACRALEPESMTDDGLAGLRVSPALFQERIRGRDLRIYVAGGTVIGACIIETDGVDYRGNETGLREITPDDEVVDLAVRSATALGMAFSGIDIKDGVDGARTVLDVNPSPMFAGIDRAIDLGVADGLAVHLLAS